MKFSNPILVATLAATLSLPVISEEQSPIIVTATRTAQTADDSLASVTVITQKEIQQSQASSIAELITGISGIDTDTNGGLGQESNVYMRGTRKGHILVLLDGVKFGSATTGRVALQYLPVSIIERIEIVRGPRSSLYGSEAIGGVIQIFTKKENKPSGGFAKLSSGTYGTANFALGLNSNTENSSFNINFDAISSNGFDVREKKNLDDDGFKNQTFNANYGYLFDNKIKLEAHFLNSVGVTEYDGAYSSSTYHRNFIEHTTGLKTIIPIQKSWDMTFSYSNSDDDRDSFKNNIIQNTYNTNRTRATWQNDISIFDSNLLTLGVDNLKDTISSSESYSVTQRETKSIFLQNQWFGKSNDILVSLRHDDIDRYGKPTTGNIAWGNHLTKNTRVTLSYGTAYKAPTFNELYHPETYSASPNPNLLAEKSESYEIGLSQNTSWGKWNINMFRTKIKDMIVFDSPSPKTNKNLENVQIDGAEFSINANLDNWITQLSLTLLNPVNTDTNEVLDRRTKQSIKLSTDKQFKGYSIGASVLSQGKRMDDGVELKGYTVINVRVKKQLDKNTSVSLKGNNITDAKYQTIDGYNMPRASTYISLEHQF